MDSNRHRMIIPFMERRTAMPTANLHEKEFDVTMADKILVRTDKHLAI